MSRSDSIHFSSHDVTCKNPTNILVLGGGGFIGSHLVDALIDRGHFVRVFERRNIDTKNLLGVISRIELIKGDFLNEDDLRGALSGIDVIVHLVSTTLPKSSNDNMLYDVETNVVGTLRLLNLAKLAGVRKVVFASSGGTVYGIPQYLPIPETHPTEPICSYGISKLAVENFIRLHSYLYGIDYTIFRIANPYGERQDVTSGQGAVSTFLWRVLTGEPIEIWGDGSIARDYLYISDLVRAFVKVIEGNNPSKVYNIGGGQAYSLNEIFETIRSVTEKTPIVNYTNARQLDVPTNCLEISKARSELNWEPRFTLAEGIFCTWGILKKSFR